MAAYVAVLADISNPEQFKRYQELAGPTVVAHGGKLLSGGSDLTTLEGEWPRAAYVLLEFESVERAKTWYASPEYREAIAAREGAAVFDMIVAPGR